MFSFNLCYAIGNMQQIGTNANVVDIHKVVPNQIGKEVVWYISRQTWPSGGTIYGYNPHDKALTTINMPGGQFTYDSDQGVPVKVDMWPAAWYGEGMSGGYTRYNWVYDTPQPKYSGIKGNYKYPMGVWRYDYGWTGWVQ